MHIAAEVGFGPKGANATGLLEPEANVTIRSKAADISRVSTRYLSNGVPSRPRSILETDSKFFFEQLKELGMGSEF